MDISDERHPSADLSDLIQTARLTEAGRRIADYVSNEPDTLAFASASDVARAVGTSEAAVSRFAKALGFSGYAELQGFVRRGLRARLPKSTTQVLTEITGAAESQDVLSRAFATDLANLQGTLRRINRGAFERTVRRLVAARTVYVAGMRASAAVAEFLGHALNLLLPDVRTLTHASGDVADRMLSIGPRDVLCAVVLSRSTQQALDLLREARRRGATVVVITDRLTAPGAASADEVLLAARESLMILASYTAAMAVAHALVAAVGLAGGRAAQTRLARFEEAAEHFMVYDRSLSHGGRPGRGEPERGREPE